MLESRVFALDTVIRHKRSVAVSVRNLDRLFQPRSVAVIGASDRERSIGALVMRNLLAGGLHRPGLAGESADTARSPACPPAPTWRRCPGRAGPGRDLHAGAHRARADRRARPQGHARGDRAHRGPAGGQRAADGRTLQQAMLDAARPYLLRVLGPNCLGLLVPGDPAERQLRARRRTTGPAGVRLAVGCAGHRDARLGQLARHRLLAFHLAGRQRRRRRRRRARLPGQRRQGPRPC